MANKVRVTKLFGNDSAVLGMMDPKVGMTTNQGDIAALNANNATVEVDFKGTGNNKLFYPHDLLVEESHASGTHAWPTGDGSVVFGDEWPNGVPDAVSNNAAFANGTDTILTSSF